jgi:hypothetical protein
MGLSNISYSNPNDKSRDFHQGSKTNGASDEKSANVDRSIRDYLEPHSKLTAESEKSLELAEFKVPRKYFNSSKKTN